MDERKFALAFLPALLRPPPEINSILRKIILVIMMAVIPPADPLWNARHRFDLESGNMSFVYSLRIGLVFINALGSPPRL